MKELARLLAETKRQQIESVRILVRVESKSGDKLVWDNLEERMDWAPRDRSQFPITDCITSIG